MKDFYAKIFIETQMFNKYKQNDLISQHITAY